MQPSLTIGLRAARAGAEKLKYQLDQKGSLLDQNMSLLAFLEKSMNDAAYVIAKSIRKAHPDHNILFEETGLNEARNPDANTSWKVRILDGELNFLTEYPSIIIVVANYVRNKPEHIAMVNVLTGAEMTCSRGRGVHYNEKRVRVSGIKKLGNSLIGVYKPDLSFPLYASLSESGSELRVTGSLMDQLISFCAGHTTALISHKTEELDIELSGLLAQEAGALAMDLSGAPLTTKSKTFMMANPRLVKELIQAVRKN